MKKSYAQIIVLLVALAITVIFLFVQKKLAPATTGVMTPPSNTPQATTFASLDITKIQKGTFEDKSNPGFAISGEYPINIVGSDYVKSDIDSALLDFKDQNNSSSMTPAELKEFGPSADHQYTFMTVYKAYKNNTFLTHRIDLYTFTGGAHGGTTVSTYTYNTNGDLIPVANLFVNNTTAVKAFSDKVVGILKGKDYTDKVNTDWLSQGAGPELRNFSAFAFDGTNFTVIFQQYQVGPYSSGIIEVPIPLADLQGILKPEYLK